MEQNIIRIFGIAMLIVAIASCSTPKNKCDAYGNGKNYKK